MSRPLLRRADAGGDLELFLVAAVTAILAIRFFLYVAGYPTVGGDALHIAHMLWGGLLMLGALLAMLSFLGPRPRRLAALAGGAGFGTFIDEVGKFVTHDNDYFYEPAVGIIYTVFVLVFLAVRTLHHGRALTPTEHLQNALNGLGEAVVRDLDPRERRRVLEHLDRSDPDHPLVDGLRAAVARVELDYPGVFIADYFSLLKIDGEWKIMNKIFDVRSRGGT